MLFDCRVHLIQAQLATGSSRYTGMQMVQQAIMM
jgi:hypothetical protein